MKVFFKYLIVTFVFVSYFQSALEVNNDFVSNTWNDEYDTYVHSKPFAAQTIIKAEHQADFALLPETFFDLQNPATKFCPTQPQNEVEKTFEQKLFLKNRSLLI